MAGKKWWIVEPTNRPPEPEAIDDAKPIDEPEPVPEPEPEPEATDDAKHIGEAKPRDEPAPTAKPKRAARRAKLPAENVVGAEPKQPQQTDGAPKPRRKARSSEAEQAVDSHVGERVRLRRTLMGLSQERLAERLGLTFQQVQKYERGANRISASKLWRLSEVLEVPVSFFFDGLREGEPAAPENHLSREVLEHVRRYTAIPEGERKSIRELTKAVAAAHGVAEEE